MHIGLLIYDSLDTLSGGYLYDRMLVAGLRENGDRVTVVSMPRRSYARNVGDNFSLNLHRRLLRLRVDLMLQDELNHPSLFLLNRRVREHVSFPVVSIVHLLQSSVVRAGWQNSFYQWVEGRYLSSVDGLVYNSATTRREAEQLLESARSWKPASLLAYPGSDRLKPQVSCEELKHRALDDPFRVLFLGNVIPRKGLHVVLRALEKLPRDQWTLTVVGNGLADPTYARAVHRQVSRAGLAPNVQFAGILSDSELSERMKSSHVLVMPSSYEGYGIVYAEAMGFGLPSVGTTSGAAREIITHGRDGFLVPPNDKVALARCLTELAENRQRLREMSVAALNRYKTLPTWKGSVDAIRTFLTELVDDATC
jgi:glycosyltransferase involved in cell wall biosynthesis